MFFKLTYSDVLFMCILGMYENTGNEVRTLNCIVLKCLAPGCIFLIHSLEKNRFPAKLYFSIDTEFDQILSRMIKTFKTASNIGIYKNKNILVIPCYDMITCHRLLIAGLLLLFHPSCFILFSMINFATINQHSSGPGCSKCG